MASIVPSKNEPMTNAKRKALLDKAADMINDNAKKIICGRIGRTPEIEEKLRIKWIKTPSYRFNRATGGGYPMGKFTIIAGNEDSGKTTALLECIGYNMKKNPEFYAAWLESENSLDIDYAVKTFGIDPERFFFIKHEKEGGAEAALDILATITETGCFSMVVINSLKCLVPKTELDNALEKDTIALQARLNSKMIKKFTAMIQEHDTAFVAITHKMTDIGAGKYQESLIITGGRAIKYAALLILDFNRLSVQDGDPVKKEEGMKIKVTVKKNHCVCDRYPYVATEYFVRYGEGVVWEYELLEAAIDMGIIKSAGAWLSEIDPNTGEVAKDTEGNAYKWNGKNAFRTFISSTPSYHERLEQMIDGNFVCEALDTEEIELILQDQKVDEEAFTEAQASDPIAESRKKKKK